MVQTTFAIESGEIRTEIGNLIQSGAVLHGAAIQVSRHDCVYTTGDSDSSVYWIESGCVKLMRTASKGGIMRPVEICGAGDIFGESCLCDQAIRSEAAVAMEDSRILKIGRDAFLSLLGADEILTSMAQNLAARIADCNRMIASLSTANEEREMILDLLHLAVRAGTRDADGLRMDRASCRKGLAALAGSTRIRVDLFLEKLEQHGFVTRTDDRCIVINDERLRAYLTGVATGSGKGKFRIQ